MSLKTTKENYQEAKEIYKEIDDIFYGLQSGEIDDSEFQLNQLLNRLKDFKRKLKYVQPQDLVGAYPDKVVTAVTKNMKTFEEALYFWERFFLASKLGRDLLDPLMMKYIPDLNLSDQEIDKFGNKKLLAKSFIGAVTHPDNIMEYENKIKRMIIGTMTSQEFRRIFDVIKHRMIGLNKKAIAAGAKIPEKLEEFMKIHEDFYNPFDEISDGKVGTPKHISDKGGILQLRKETFNLARVEFSKRPGGGEYTVLAKTQFARGEIVEICPVILLGEEAKTIDKLKDTIFEIDRNRNEWALVLGYGSLYRHSKKANLEYAYNKLTKQMYFITKNAIKLGDELTINYGQDYWMERMTFKTFGDERTDKNQGMPTSGKVNTVPEGKNGDIEESEVQPNAADIKGTESIKSISAPNNPANPVRSGIAIIGSGQS